MYRVLIVDDDKLIVDDLISLLDWNALGCTVPDSAADGRQALGLLQAHPYDIVLTDISMPIMDGVELIRKAKEQNMPAVFLVISNYDDFVLVKEAMKYGAAEYLLKYEITAQTLAQQVQYAQEMHQKQDSRTVRKDDAWAQSKLKIQRLYRQEIKDFQIGLPPSDGVWIPITIILFEKATDQKLTFLSQILTQISLASEETISLFTELEDHKALLLLCVKNPSYLLSIKTATNHIQALMKQARDDGLPIAAYIGQFCHQESELGAFIYGLKEQEHPLFYLKPYSAAQNCQYNAQSDISFDLDAWKNTCRNEAPDVAVTKLMAFFQLNRVPKDRVKSYCAKLVASIASTPEIEHTSVTVIWAANTAWDISKVLLKILEEQSLITLNMQRPVRKEIRSVLTYIAENYRKQISLTELADTACLSPNYFCKIFKSETGLTYTDYLSSFRLEQAKRLLRSTAMRTHEIAEKVGFRDYRYFCRIFKEATGLTCSEYRREYGDNR